MLTQLKAPTIRIARSAVIAQAQIEECQRVLEKTKAKLGEVSCADPLMGFVAKRLDQLEAGLDVAQNHAFHKLCAAKLMNARGHVYLEEYEKETDLPEEWVARDNFLVAKKKKRQVDDATIATAHVLQPRPPQP